MIFKKALQPPAHFRRFVAAKESWGIVWKKLEFRPKTKDPTLRRQCIEAETQSAITSSYLLLAVECFEIISAEDKRLITIAGEEQILFECLAFAASIICNGVNPESEEYEMLLDKRHSLTDLFNLMSLLDREEIEDTALSRFELYDKASSSTNREAYLSSSYARVLTYLTDGEKYSHIKIRYEDAPNLLYGLAANRFLSHAAEKLKEMVSRIVKREMDEEYDFET